MSEGAGKRVRVKQILDLVEGLEGTLHDFQVSASDDRGNIKMVDLELIDQDEDNMVEYKLQPGAWRVTPKNGLQPIKLAEELYIETADSKLLSKHFTTFFNKLHIYARRQLLPSRKILFGSEQGRGKSSLIRSFCRSVKLDDGMCILRIDSADVSWETMTQMFMKAKPDDVKRIVLIVEDIGGTALDERRHRVEPDLLNFLDGNSDVYKVPTLVIGTTNFLNEVGAVLNDRPGRFDVVKQLDSLSDEDTLVIVEAMEGRKLSDAEKKAMLGKEFTPAYCQEALLRAELHDITIEESVDELLEQRKRSKNKKHGERSTSVGFASDDFD